MKVPVEHKGLAESMQSMVDATVAAARSSRGGSVSERRAGQFQSDRNTATEKAIAERTAAIERAAHAEVLRALDVDTPRFRVRGAVCTPEMRNLLQSHFPSEVFGKAEQGIDSGT
ncbi:MAG: hypothetical protein R3F56_00500 [Planctomycetota bacterium]